MSETPNDEDEDIIYTDGEFITNTERPHVQALLIRNGRIAAVGTNDEVLAQAGSRPRAQSLDSATPRPMPIISISRPLRPRSRTTPRHRTTTPEMGYGMTVNMSFTFGIGDMLTEGLGPGVLTVLNPLRQLLDAGLTVSGSMDWVPRIRLGRCSSQ